jgi:DNA-binding transcriptional regulator YiaG
MIIWKTIDRFPDYEVSNEGQVRRSKGGRGAIAGKLLKWHTHTSTGYPDIRFSVEGKQTSIPVHRIVATAFFGAKPDDMQIRHLDGNKMNNHIDNLCYGTAKENAQDKIQHGRSSQGIKNPKNKLTEHQVESIRKMHGTSKAKNVAYIFGLSKSTVYRIWNKKYWNHL